MRLSRIAVLLIFLLGFQTLPTFGQVVATWTDASGNWSNALNWSSNPAVPNNGGGISYNVVINGTGSDTVTFDASGTIISGLTIGQGETFQDKGLTPTLTTGSLSNNGTITWGSGANLNVRGWSNRDPHF